MTNEELIAKIKAEIEGLKEICTAQIKANPGQTFPFVMEMTGYDKLLSFLSTLESEKPMNPEELGKEITRTYHDGSVADTTEMDHVDYENIARHFAQWGYLRAAEKYNEVEYNRQRAEEPVSDDLEEAAEKFARFYDQGTCDGIAQDCFIAGAKWQAEQDEKEQADLFTIVALDAAQRAKEQMMKEAVEAEVLLTPYPTICLDDCKDYDFKDGQKVRIIIVKEN